MIPPERVIQDYRRECEHCSAPGFYTFQVNGFKFNYCNNYLKECDISLDEVDGDYSPIEDRLERFIDTYLKWKKER